MGIREHSSFGFSGDGKEANEFPCFLGIAFTTNSNDTAIDPCGRKCYKNQATSEEGLDHTTEHHEQTLRKALNRTWHCFPDYIRVTCAFRINQTFEFPQSVLHAAILPKKKHRVIKLYLILSSRS